MSKYSVQQHPVETLLSWIKSGEIAIPEIQRPFVRKAAKVRDLTDSLYKGYPVGYIITWRNPDVKLKNGETSVGKRIVMLHVFVKKTQKIPKKELMLAKQRMKEVQENDT